MSIKIEKAGLLTTIQDTGRYGYQKDGIIVSGAMDATALRIANLLVDNNENEAAIEVTLVGPKIRFHENHLIAITGADLAPEIDGEQVQMWRPVYVKAGSLLQFKGPVNGSRAYIAISGSIAIPKVMNSYSTYLRAEFGGLNGKALQAGDVIPCKDPATDILALLKKRGLTNSDKAFIEVKWKLAPQLYPAYEENPTIRVVKGTEYELFSESSKSYLWKEKFQITSQSDRMAHRLQGVNLSLQEDTELISSAVTFGTIQVPAQGSPIILLADRQTTGGYPRIAQVITADFSQLAQIQPGKIVRFTEVTLQQAQQLYVKQEQNIEQIKRALDIKRS
ncbi:biotin-dependent carboxyltransferase family protein [Pontibacter silvestris]|uniref:Biotin-dependent carboxyltransferase family protein n=1 Tax=Pontibacter silvestris TaxID=2305183 RepID=A0ABW4WYL1_9BACT|nr:biotin-dependent carboxyltransferase family protein [Pontibacter silvestris]MCC9135623.1 biotin-dependent carboxyltransferase family protein [Pontibacter silvestris]